MSEQLEMNIQETPQKEMKGPSYEDAVRELEEIVQKLERGDAPLEESGKLYERGVKLSTYCTKILQEMEEKMTRLSLTSEGEIKEEEIDIR